MDAASLRFLSERLQELTDSAWVQNLSLRLLLRCLDAVTRTTKRAESALAVAYLAIFRILVVPLGPLLQLVFC